MISLFVESLKVVIFLIPFLITYLVYRIVYSRTANERKAIHRSIAYSTLFYLIGTLYFIHAIFDKYFISYILIGFIALLGLILIIQWKNNNEVVLLKGIKTLWRFSFLLFLMSYLILIIYNLGAFIYKTFI